MPGFVHFRHQHPLTFKLTPTFKRRHQHRRELLVANITMSLTSMPPNFWQEWCWWQRNVGDLMPVSVFRPVNTESWWQKWRNRSPTSLTSHQPIFLELTRLFSEDDFAENNCFDGKNLYAYPCRGKCFQYIGLYESNVI